ncbi:MAG: mechanosensitive ion channel family protein, partial [Paraperlucidibaca sp.]
MLDLLPGFIDAAFIRDLLITGVYFVVLVGVRVGVGHAILKREKLEPEMKQRWLVSVRNITFVLFLLGLALIWAREIETVAVSMVAVAAAIVLATREMILCLLGALYRSSTNAYSIGDRIEINGLKGQVMDADMLSTTLIEITQASVTKGSFGRVVTIPNSQLLTQSVFNESRLGRFAMHTVMVQLPRAESWQAAEIAMLQTARDEIGRYASDLVKHARELQRQHGLGVPMLTPRLRVVLNNFEYTELQLYLPVPIVERFDIEQRVVRAAAAASKASIQTASAQLTPSL